MNERKITWVLLLVVMCAVLAHATHTAANGQLATCITPGTQVVTDDDGDDLDMLRLDVETVSIAEPFFSDGIARLAITVKTEKLYPMIIGSRATGPDAERTGLFRSHDHSSRRPSIP